ncbi:MAG: DUF2147 domain-containing protein [Lewinellaceae bacterium]|nr:DUF2147 domain-containing protein [Saprospiraceae bacterium]MCB9337456.1 DUF2147 domain-containing protein [Lewinellaceae bacterium]
MKAAIAFFAFIACAAHLFGQDVVGHWKTIDDASGEAKSIIEIYKDKDGSYYGKIVKLFLEPNEDPDPICTKCPNDDPRYRKKINGMTIISSLEKNGTEYAGGEIMDPENGKSYNCKIWTEGADKLKVRGYWGFFYRTQTWQRVDRY